MKKIIIFEPNYISVYENENIIEYAHLNNTGHSIVEEKTPFDFDTNFKRVRYDIVEFENEEGIQNVVFADTELNNIINNSFDYIINKKITYLKGIIDYHLLEIEHLNRNLKVKTYKIEDLELNAQAYNYNIKTKGLIEHIKDWFKYRKMYGKTSLYK